MSYGRLQEWLLLLLRTLGQMNNLLNKMSARNGWELALLFPLTLYKMNLSVRG